MTNSIDIVENQLRSRVAKAQGRLTKAEDEVAKTKGQIGKAGKARHNRAVKNAKKAREAVGRLEKELIGHTLSGDDLPSRKNTTIRI